MAAISSSELLNYTDIARETGVSAKVIRRYFDILESTLLGTRIFPWKKSLSRRLVQTEKFYLFDVGLTNYLSKRKPKKGTPEFGKSFEHFILMELRSYKRYQDPELEIRFWRSASQIEVDFILGELDVAIEVKAKNRVTSKKDFIYPL